MITRKDYNLPEKNTGLPESFISFPENNPAARIICTENPVTQSQQNHDNRARLIKNKSPRARQQLTKCRNWNRIAAISS
jgi:hypothetical protein